MVACPAGNPSLRIGSKSQKKRSEGKYLPPQRWELGRGCVRVVDDAQLVDVLFSLSPYFHRVLMEGKLGPFILCYQLRR